MKKAVIQTGSKQYLVKEGDVVSKMMIIIAKINI